MGRGPISEKNRRRIFISLEGDRFDPIFTYAQATAPDQPVQDAIRDLLLQAVSDDPILAAVRQAKIVAHREAKLRIHKDVAAKLREIAVELEIEPLGDEALTLPTTGNVIGE